MPVNNPNVIYPELSYSIIGAAMDVHNELGPGWAEWDYHRAMIEALAAKGHKVDSHGRRGLVHRGKIVGHFELDLLVDELVVLEFKHVRSGFHPAHYTQIINYLKHWEVKLGILINFGLECLCHKRVPFDPKCGAVECGGKWDELAVSIPDLCKTVLEAIDFILCEYGVGYSADVYKKLVLAELLHRGSSALLPVVSPSFGLLGLGERQLDVILIESRLLVMVSATGQSASSVDLACLKSYMKQLSVINGLLIDVGGSGVQLKGVL